MKKGIELSMNFLVVIVLTLVIFIFSIYFILTIYEKAKGMQTRTFDDLDKQIGYLRCGTEQVCIGEKTKEIRRNEFSVFGIRILNVLGGQRKFTIFVKESLDNKNIYGYSDHPIRLLPKASSKPDPACGDEARCELIDPDKGKNFALGAEVDAATPKGTYVFDVYVQYDDVDGNHPYGETPKSKIYVIVP